MLTDHDLRVRAIRRRERADHVLGRMIFDSPCKWTKRGRAKIAQWGRVWGRILSDYEMVVGSLNPFQIIRGYVYEDAADAHVAECRCRRCPRTPPRRMSKVARKRPTAASGDEKGGARG